MISRSAGSWQDVSQPRITHHAHHLHRFARGGLAGRARTSDGPVRTPCMRAHRDATSHMRARGRAGRRIAVGRRRACAASCRTPTAPLSLASRGPPWASRSRSAEFRDMVLRPSASLYCGRAERPAAVLVRDRPGLCAPSLPDSGIWSPWQVDPHGAHDLGRPRQCTERKRLADQS